MHNRKDKQPSLQLHGFTLGVRDILVLEQADEKRLRELEKLRKCGDKVVRETFNLPEDSGRAEQCKAMAKVCYCLF